MQIVINQLSEPIGSATFFDHLNSLSFSKNLQMGIPRAGSLLYIQFSMSIHQSVVANNFLCLLTAFDY